MVLYYQFNAGADEYSFEIDNDELVEAICHFYCKTSTERTCLANFITDNDFDLSCYQDIAEEYWYNRAYEYWEESEEAERDPYGYRGLNRSDFD